jgi:hypothetical protein
MKNSSASRAASVIPSSAPSCSAAAKSGCSAARPTLPAIHDSVKTSLPANRAATLDGSRCSSSACCMAVQMRRRRPSSTLISAIAQGASPKSVQTPRNSTRVAPSTCFFAANGTPSASMMAPAAHCPDHAA